MFKFLYAKHFPNIRVKFNKNKHEIKGYMKEELLILIRMTKDEKGLAFFKGLLL
jgi:hypothetical protein